MAYSAQVFEQLKFYGNMYLLCRYNKGEDYVACPKMGELGGRPTACRHAETIGF
ncbi:hypothetical protein NmNIID838_05450 [Neisseria meningitidis]|nr:hypothetical protein NmNIID835_05410 [Neisseria meningitidis]BEQ21194.1 hypothetical protein NmNIID836_17860 [Neisseria meningitidis]BEQ22012.1 hypothetical protein NmNIID838_05450 [Neisseria meningitidis]